MLHDNLTFETEIIPTSSTKRRSVGNKVGCATEVCDLILFQPRKRFKFTGHLEATTMLDFSAAAKHLQMFPHSRLNACAQAYPMI